MEKSPQFNIEQIQPERAGLSGVREDKDKGRDEAEKIKKEATEKIGDIFDNFSTGKERVCNLMSILEPFLKNNDIIEGEAIKKALEGCVTADQKDVFIKGVMDALQPVIDLKSADPGKFEQAQRRVFVKEGGFTSLSEVLSYGQYKDVAHIHLAPAEKYGVAKARRSMQEGLKKLAKIIVESPEIKTIEAISWIVAKNPKIIESFGFKNEGQIDEETKALYFDKEKRPVSRAVMTREDFLARYLK